MYSDNYLEVVLTAVGWDFYGKIVTMIYSLGLHFLPLVFVMFKNWRDTQTSMDPRNASEAEMSRNFFDVGIMMLVIILFWLPNSNTTFDPSEYTQAIQAESSDPNSSQVFKQAQEAMGVSSTTAIDIPPGWYILINGIKATINQLKEWLVLSPTAKAILTVYNNLKIEDDQVRAESDLFYSQCYLPAQKRYQNTMKPVASMSSDDESYIGNDVFVNTPGLYKACTQSDIDNGTCLGDPLTMPFTAAEKYGITTRFTDTTTITQDGRPLTYSSTPSCYQWWTGDFDEHYVAGTINREPLKDVLYEQAAASALKQEAMGALLPAAGQSTLGSFMNWASNTFGSGAKDRTIRSMLKTDQPDMVADPDDSYEAEAPATFLGFLKSMGQKGVDTVQGFLAGVGAGMTAVTLGVVLEALDPALKMIQAGLVFGVLLYLAITLPIGGFSAETVIKHGMILFGVLMLSLIWHVADILNEGLLRILYPNPLDLLKASFNTTGLLFQIFLFLLYILLPAVFLMMMREAGYRLADSYGNAMNEFKQSAGKGVGLAGKGIKKGK